MKTDEIIKFKPRYSPEIELTIGDGFSFQWAGQDEDGEEVMYNNSAEVTEKDGELKICWNGGYYEPYYFLWCDHLDGNISMDSINKF